MDNENDGWTKIEITYTDPPSSTSFWAKNNYQLWVDGCLVVSFLRHPFQWIKWKYIKHFRNITFYDRELPPKEVLENYNRDKEFELNE